MSNRQRKPLELALGTFKIFCWEAELASLMASLQKLIIHHGLQTNNIKWIQLNSTERIPKAVCC